MVAVLGASPLELGSISVKESEAIVTQGTPGCCGGSGSRGVLEATLSVANATREAQNVGNLVVHEGLNKGCTAAVSTDMLACRFKLTNRSPSATIASIRLHAGGCCLLTRSLA